MVVELQSTIKLWTIKTNSATLLALFVCISIILSSLALITVTSMMSVNKHDETTPNPQLAPDPNARAAEAQLSVFMDFLSMFRIEVKPEDQPSYNRYPDLRDKYSKVFQIVQDEYGSYIALIGIEDLDSPIEDLDSPIVHDDAFFYMVYGVGPNIAGITEPIFFCQINGAGSLAKDFYFKDVDGEHLILEYREENWPLKKPRSVYLEYDTATDKLLKFE